MCFSLANLEVCFCPPKNSAIVNHISLYMHGSAVLETDSAVSEPKQAEFQLFISDTSLQPACSTCTRHWPCHGQFWVFSGFHTVTRVYAVFRISWSIPKRSKYCWCFHSCCTAMNIQSAVTPDFKFCMRDTLFKLRFWKFILKVQRQPTVLFWNSYLPSNLMQLCVRKNSAPVLVFRSRLIGFRRRKSNFYLVFTSPVFEANTSSFVQGLL